MDGVNIRNVTEQDLDACFLVEKRCFLPAEAASREKIERRIRLFPQGFLVAELDNRIIGFINGAATHQEEIAAAEFKDMIGHEAGGRNMVAFALAVVPEFRRKGIARQLMSSFIDVASQLKKEKVMLICKSNLIDYYESFGFIYAGESASTHGGSRWHEMVLPLGRISSA
jgi:ribosomal protein S18 acetylase RimI-like enzyme